MQPLWQNKRLSLGERCVAFAENEMHTGVKEDKPNSFSSARIAQYFSICRRRGTEKLLGLTSGNWCAAAVSFCVKNSLIETEQPPHGYRAGAIEIENDMKENGTWRPVKLAIEKSFKPQKGDVVIFDRSDKSIPSSSWWRHIGFYYDDGKDGTFKLISGNNYGQWRIDTHSLTSKRLLGFGEYPDCVRKCIKKPEHVLVDTPDVSDLDIVEQPEKHNKFDPMIFFGVVGAAASYFAKLFRKNS
jgi:hypothetical protein